MVCGAKYLLFIEKLIILLSKATAFLLFIHNQGEVIPRKTEGKA